MIQVLRTPLIPIYADSEQRIYLKPENLQPFGSYKVRGVASVIGRAKPQDLKNGLCAASAGNMAQAVAYGAKQLGVRCRIYVPDVAPEVKKTAIRNLGAELIEKPFADVWKMVTGELKTDDPGIFIHPALNEDLLAGYAKIADELIEDLPDLDAVVIPFGVGGLALGIAKRINRLRPQIAIYLTEPATAAPFHASRKLGRPTSIVRTPSFVDAIGTPEVLPLVYEQLAPLIKDSIVVSLPEVQAAMRMLYLNQKLVAEGAGAAALAAAVQLASSTGHRKIAAIISGGNIDHGVFQSLVGTLV